jgi:hypothetical protein
MGGACSAGGGIFNGSNGTLIITASTFSRNSESDGTGGGISNGGTLTITASTFSGNSALYGGGIENYNALTVTASTFSGNSAESGDGGGIFNGNNGTLIITASTFSGNSEFDGDGGGIFNGNNGTLIITASTISGNSEFDGDGGGIFNGGTLTITASTFSGNSASSNGGGIYNLQHSTLTITASTFSGNSVGGGGSVGGGIFNEGTLTISASTFSGNVVGGIFNEGTLTISASTFSGNSAEGGGGIWNDGTLTITDCTISGNSAGSQFGGGGIENFGTLTVTDSTFSGNSSALYGGGIYNSPGGGGILAGTIRMRNTLLAGNTALLGPDVSGPIISLGHNLIANGDGGSGYMPTDMVGTLANPIDPKLGPLQDNGGPTQTMALLPGSPAIGASGPTDSEWDQRGPGYARTINGMTDIGAYEVLPSGAGSAAHTLHSPELTHPMPVVALSGPSTPSIPLRQTVTATVDRVFASWTYEPASLLLGRSTHAALVEQGLWQFDFVMRCLR